MSIGGVVIRFGGFGLRILQFCVAAIGLGIFSYFLSVLADRDFAISNKWLAVEGITGAATLYTLCAIVFTLFLGGKAFFGYLAVLLDVCFVGAYAAVAYLTRHGASSCSGNVRTPLGDGPSNQNDSAYGSNGFGFGAGENSTYFPNLKTACVLNTVVFATAIISIVLFIISAFWQILMVRHHKKEKAFGPGPANNYTAGAGKKPFWKRGGRNKHAHNKDVETAGVIGADHHHHNTSTAVRPSHETGTTLGHNNYATEPKFGQEGYGQPAYAHHATTRGNF